MPPRTQHTAGRTAARRLDRATPAKRGHRRTSGCKRDGHPQDTARAARPTTVDTAARRAGTAIRQERD